MDLCICSNSRHVPHHSSVPCLFILASNSKSTVKNKIKKTNQLILLHAVRKAVLSMMAVRKMSMMTSENKLSNLSPSAQELASNINKYLEDSEKEVVDGDNAVVHQHTDDGNGGLGVTGDSKTLLSPTDVNAPPLTPVVQQLKVASITK